MSPRLAFFAFLSAETLPMCTSSDTELWHSQGLREWDCLRLYQTVNTPDCIICGPIRPHILHGLEQRAGICAVCSCSRNNRF